MFDLFLSLTLCFVCEGGIADVLALLDLPDAPVKFSTCRSWCGNARGSRRAKEEGRRGIGCVYVVGVGGVSFLA